MQRIKKKQNNIEGNSTLKANKSSKVTDLAKELENNMQKRIDIFTEGNENVINVVYENNENKDDDNMINVLKNQQLSKSIKKKKIAKAFADDNNDNE